MLKGKTIDQIVEELGEMLDRQGIKSHYLDEEGSNQIWQEQHKFLRSALQSYGAWLIDAALPDYTDVPDHKKPDLHYKAGLLDGTLDYANNMKKLNEGI